MSGRRVALVLVWTLPSIVFVAATAIVYAAFRIAPPERLDERDRAAVMAPLRAAMSGADGTPCSLHRGAGPIAVTVWLDGRSVARADGYGDDLGAATDSAAKQLRESRQLRAWPTPARDRMRIQVDVVSGHAPLAGGEWLFDALAVPGIGEMLAIAPGLDGIGGDVGGHAALVLPHELVTSKLLSAKQPSDIVPDLAIGVDFKKLGGILAVHAGQPAGTPARALYRFRTDAFVEPPLDQRGRPPLALMRGITAPPRLSGPVLRAAALAGGRYLVAHLAPNGRYNYEHDLTTGQKTDPAHSTSYSMPRHAGTTYFLAQLYRITKEPWLREPIERAFAHLVDLLAAGHCGGALADGTPFDCVLDKGETTAQLGATALAVVALVEYQRATDDTRYLPLVQKLAAWILFMQRPDGSFRHLYDPRTKQPDEHEQLLYYSGEAALALARLHEVTGDPRYAQAAERALDWLVDWYDFFMGGFFYGEEHWTCIAAEALWPAVKSDNYRRFCDDYGAFLRAQQPAVGEHPDEDDLAGAYNVTPFVAPYNTPAGSRTEAMISAYLLDLHHGVSDPRLRDQIARALQYLLGQQVRPETDFSAVGDVDGGMPGSPIDRNVRIDYVQHVCSAMIRASEWIDQSPP